MAKQSVTITIIPEYWEQTNTAIRFIRQELQGQGGFSKVRLKKKPSGAWVIWFEASGEEPSVAAALQNIKKLELASFDRVKEDMLRNLRSGMKRH